MIALSSPNNVAATIPTGVKQAEHIAGVTRGEASQIAAFELDQVLAVLDQLDGDDWWQPTDCTDWHVRDMTAHLAGACAGYARWRDFRRQSIFNRHLFKTSVTVDALNKRQLEDRAGRSPQELVAELREVGPKAIRTRKNLPGLLRQVRLPRKPMPGFMSVAYLVDIIYPRDQWMHRMDICRATGKEFVVTAAHDGRLLDLVMRDVAEVLDGKLAIQVNITGALTASYRFGRTEPAAEIDIDFFTFNRRASMRLTVEETLPEVTVRGAEAVAQAFVEKCPVLY